MGRNDILRRVMGTYVAEIRWYTKTQVLLTINGYTFSIDRPSKYFIWQNRKYIVPLIPKL